MKMISHWSKPIALLALGLSAMGGIKANATMFTTFPTNSKMIAAQPTEYPNRGTIQLAQRLVGECRAATRSTFIYRERSTASPIRALQVNERVILAEDLASDGWIAVTSPISGFVQTKELKRCSNNSSTNPPSLSRPNLCRQVIYQGNEGVAVREKPTVNSPQVNNVLFGDRVTLSNPPEFLTDSTGREWAKLAVPRGWMSNGVPARGDINLVACF
jgi:hypothetical protein